MTNIYLVIEELAKLGYPILIEYDRIHGHILVDLCTKSDYRLDDMSLPETVSLLAEIIESFN